MVAMAGASTVVSYCEICEIVGFTLCLQFVKFIFSPHFRSKRTLGTGLSLLIIK